MKGKKQALLASGLCLGLSAALLTGATFAWFTDSVTNKGNTIQAGTLEVKFQCRDLMSTDGYGYEDVPEKADDAGALFTDGQIWEPGYSYGYDFKVKNDGSYRTGVLAFNYQLEVSNIQMAEGDTADIAEVLNVYVIGVNEDSFGEDDFVGTLAELREDRVVYSSDKVMQKGFEDVFSVVIEMDPKAGSTYQGCGVTFDLNLVAKQATFEEDGFGSNEYDASAEYVNPVGGNDFSNGKGDWSGGAVSNGELVPTEGVYSWYNNYENKNVRLGDSWTASVDINVDSTVDGQLFEITNAVNKKDNTHLRDFVVHFEKLENGNYAVLMSNNANNKPYGDPYAQKYAAGIVTTSGWYTMKWEYSVNDDQALTCKMSLVDRETGVVVATKTLSNAADTNDIVGFNHYLWVCPVSQGNFAGFHLDNQKLVVND